MSTPTSDRTIFELRDRPANLELPLVVGEANPYGSDPRYALWPDPPNCAGWRLCRKILGLQPEEYLRRFDRANLLSRHDDKWDVRETRRAAGKLQASGRKKFVLLGARVARAFHAEPPALFCVTKFVQGAALEHVWHLVLPHPSGRSRVWNEPGVAERARAAVAAMEAAR